jgi:hypothetical protein
VSGIDDIRQRLAEIDDWPDIQRLLAVAEAALAIANIEELVQENPIPGKSINANDWHALLEALAALDQAPVT